MEPPMGFLYSIGGKCGPRCAWGWKMLAYAVHTVFNKSQQTAGEEYCTAGEAGGLLQETVIKLQETTVPLEMKNGENKERPTRLHKGPCKDLRL